MPIVFRVRTLRISRGELRRVPNSSEQAPHSPIKLTTFTNKTIHILQKAHHIHRQTILIFQQKHPHSPIKLTTFTNKTILILQKLTTFSNKAHHIFQQKRPHGVWSMRIAHERGAWALRMGMSMSLADGSGAWGGAWAWGRGMRIRRVWRMVRYQWGIIRKVWRIG